MRTFSPKSLLVFFVFSSDVAWCQEGIATDGLRNRTGSDIVAAEGRNAAATAMAASAGGLENVPGVGLVVREDGKLLAGVCSSTPLLLLLSLGC
jgi:hypothetical protein